MGARGYRTLRTEARRSPGKAEDWQAVPVPIRRCVRHTKRPSTGWDKLGLAAGVHLCDDCHNAVVQKCFTDQDFVEALKASKATAERAISEALKEVA